MREFSYKITFREIIHFNFTNHEKKIELLLLCIVTCLSLSVFEENLFTPSLVIPVNLRYRFWLSFLDQNRMHKLKKHRCI